MRSVLLTGARGFIGRHCLDVLLERGFFVHATSSRGQSTSSDAVEWHQVDLLNSKDARALVEAVKPMLLLHTAWYSTPADYWKSEENYRWYRAGIDLLRNFRAAGGRRAVVTGSCAEYDPHAGHCDERTTPLSPATVYGTCKNRMRQEADELASSTGLSLGWGRIFHVYGPHEPPTKLVASVSRSLLSGDVARVTHGAQKRDYLFVRDVASALITFLESPVSGAVNIGSGQAVALRDVVDTIAMLAGGAKDRISLGSLPDRKDDPPLIVANVDRLTTEIGFAPQYTLESGLADTIEWWRKAENDG